MDSQESCVRFMQLLEKISAEAVKLSQAIQSLRKKMEHTKPSLSNGDKGQS
jgi:hypothetical protein